MKKLLTLLLASAMLLSALPAAFAEESDGGPVLADASPFVINEETGYIENIPEFITARELRNHFCDKDKVTVTAANGSALKLDDLVGTDALVTVGGKSVKALVHGDVNRDAKITTNDAVAILRHLASMKVDIAADAIDVNYDGKSTATDAVLIIRYLAGWEVDITNRAIYGADAAENEDSTVSMYFDSIMNRISETDTVGSGDLTYTVRTAKNEIEDVQILLSSTEDKTGLTLEVGDIVNQNGDVIPMEVRYGHYYEFGIIDTDGDRFVDPYIKLEGSFDLPANLSRSFLIKVKTPIDAEAGLYKTTVNVRDAEGRIIKTGTVRVYVWDFALDEETACDTAFCLGGLLGTDEYVSGYDYMLENRISAYAIPYNVLDDRADAYLDNPRVTSTCLHTPGYGGTMGNSEEDIVAAYAKLRTNPVWLEKGYLYPVDEPYMDEQFVEAANFYNRMSELMPQKDFQIVIPLASNYYNTIKKVDFTDLLDEYVNIWCPQSYAFRPYMTYAEYKEVAHLYPPKYDFYQWVTTPNYQQYGDWIARYESFRARGDKMWWYICCAPEVPYANFFQCYQGVVQRIVLWQQYMFDIDGLLYWHVANYAIDGTTSTVSAKRTNGGDGLLLYKGEMFGSDEFYLPSIRFESVRDGIEDFQYLTQLESLVGREEAMKFVNRLTLTILSYTDEYTDMVEVRDELGYYLESLSAAE